MEEEPPIENAPNNFGTSPASLAWGYFWCSSTPYSDQGISTNAVTFSCSIRSRAGNNTPKSSSWKDFRAALITRSTKSGAATSCKNGLLKLSISNAWALASCCVPIIHLTLCNWPLKGGKDQEAKCAPRLTIKSSFWFGSACSISTSKASPDSLDVPMAHKRSQMCGISPLRTASSPKGSLQLTPIATTNMCAIHSLVGHCPARMRATNQDSTHTLDKINKCNWGAGSKTSSWLVVCLLELQQQDVFWLCNWSAPTRKLNNSPAWLVQVGPHHGHENVPRHS